MTWPTLDAVRQEAIRQWQEIAQRPPWCNLDQYEAMAMEAAFIMAFIRCSLWLTETYHKGVEQLMQEAQE